MNKNLKLILLAVLFIVLLAGAGMLYNTLGSQVDKDQLATKPNGTASTDPTEDTRVTAPDIILTDWAGSEVSLSDFAGKPVILNFWASWCGPCQMEMPDFEEAYLKYGSEIHFLMVNCTASPRETRQSAVSFIQQAGYTFPVYFDLSGASASAYGASSIPLTYFIDAEGYPVAYGQGALDAATLQKGIDMIYNPDE